jgi:YHS domain-containing protein
MKRFIALIATVAFVATASLYGAEKVKLDGVKCPVSGKAVKAEHAVAYKGGKAYFCCPNCPKAFAGNTAKFAAKANHQLYATGQFTLVACPLTKKTLNTATKVEIGGKAVSFCCNGCKGKVTKAEDKIALVFADAAFAKGFKVAKAKK